MRCRQNSILIALQRRKEYHVTGNFCGQLRTAEIKIAEYYVK
jgi:hypothetical protein